MGCATSRSFCVKSIWHTYVREERIMFADVLITPRFCARAVSILLKEKHQALLGSLLFVLWQQSLISFLEMRVYWSNGNYKSLFSWLQFITSINHNSSSTNLLPRHNSGINHPLLAAICTQSENRFLAPFTKPRASSHIYNTSLSIWKVLLKSLIIYTWKLWSSSCTTFVFPFVVASQRFHFVQLSPTIRIKPSKFIISENIKINLVTVSRHPLKQHLYVHMQFTYSC